MAGRLALLLAVVVSAPACGSSDAAEDARPSAESPPPEAPPLEQTASPPEAPPTASAPRKTPLLERVTLEVSSSYPGWPASFAVDGHELTSWYSGSNDSVAQGRKPFFQMTFAEVTVVRKVTVLGNRDPNFYNGYAILQLQLDVFDTNKRLVSTLVAESTGDRHDFQFELSQEAEGVGALRFTSLRDLGNKNWWGDVAIAEIILD